MFGALAKSYFAEKIGVDPKRIFVVSIMPCTAKKARRPCLPCGPSATIPMWMWC